MNILYGFSGCSEKKYIELFKKTNIMIAQQAQKYHSLLIEGLYENGMDITCISGLPINRNLTKKYYIRGQKEIVNNVKYHYFGTVNISFIRQIIIFIKAFFYILYHDKFDVVICDILNISIASGMLLGVRIRRYPIIGIVTDVPGYFSSTGKLNIMEFFNSTILKYFNGYVFLTEAMNEVVNKRNRPYIVQEGYVDWKMKNYENLLSKKTFPKILLFAGTLDYIFGIEVLTEAFINVDASDWELHIYGDGEYANKLRIICSNNNKIKYFGYRLNREIIDAEIRASLLVNPRPTNKEYVKYSFPSKNMEYMVSGTPLLTTLLPGMPLEYKKYVYLFDDESIEGMTETLKILFVKKPEELHDLGKKAKKYVLEEKNNVKQAGKVIQLFKMII
jgi:glycosyltransferase involved in cell wall biosynthesis